ncbi:MAG: hypothetical protein JNL82_21565 [Myxococcales bacterium]|nr:hypothetical protein [Myxococcales bacterium]
MLLAPEFADGCIGDDADSIKIHIESTYADRFKKLKPRLATRSNGPTPPAITFGKYQENGDDTTCETAPAADPAHRVNIYLNFARSEGEFSSVDVVVRRGGECKQTRLIRGEYPTYCRPGTVPRYRPDPSDLPPPRAQASTRDLPRQPRIPYDGSGMMVLGGSLATIALGMALSPIPVVADINNAVAVNCLAFGAARRGERDAHDGAIRNPRPYLSTGILLVTAGSIAWLTSFLLFVSEPSEFNTEDTRRILGSIGIPATAIGAGLLTYGVSYRNTRRDIARKRLSIAPQLGPRHAGLSLTARF